MTDEKTETKSLLEQVETVVADVEAVIERGKEIAALREKQGRRIGATTRATLVTLTESLRQAEAALVALTEDPSEHADAVRHELARFEQLRDASDPIC